MLSNDGTEDDGIKLVYDPHDGHTDNYFGGEGEPDGPGHGHIRANEAGDLSIIRGSYTPGVPFARRDATELETPPPRSRYIEMADDAPPPSRPSPRRRSGGGSGGRCGACGGRH